jgi:hypothetical protein
LLGWALLGVLANPAAHAAPSCDAHDPHRQAFFGDLHVHTGFSQDAYIFGTRSTPSDAYRFAKGEPLQVNGRSLQLDRPLDFAAVTDHAEFLGAVGLCTRPGSGPYDSASCKSYRSAGFSDVTDFGEVVRAVIRRNAALESDEVCGADGRACRDADVVPWLDIQRAAETHRDSTRACSFSTFVAYEYSLTPDLSKIHRNVIFRNATVIPRPIHAQDEPEPLSMLRRLRNECIDGIEGCDVLAIPHNPNLSDGRMFRTEYPGSLSRIQEQRVARLRASMEPVVEIMQIKGDSECRNGLIGVAGPPDELCDFEKMRAMQPKPPPDCDGGTSKGALIGKGCVGRDDFARYALIAGLAEEERIGVNPYQFGLAASTDEHEGTMGNVAEGAYADPASRGTQRPNTNPGGLFGVWAEENSREVLFDAIRRREVFGTSGPRIQPRFFGGFDMERSLCDDPELVAKAYASGQPMGSVLPAATGDASPRFLVTAMRDPGLPDQPGGKLERLQIIKGWVGRDRVYEQRIYDVAGQATSTEAELDTGSCEPSGRGHDALCAEWVDPDFNPTTRAVYYARIVEMPSCRWSTQLCNAADSATRPAWCDDDNIPNAIRERAWTSPIWYGPSAVE